MGQRIKDENTSICEQVFSWFRGYAPICNEMRTNRHKFLLFYFAKRHNMALLHGSARYLRPVPNEKKKKPSVPYGCPSSKKMSKSKVMKKPVGKFAYRMMNAMKVMKVMKRSMKWTCEGIWPILVDRDLLFIASRLD